MVEQTHAARCAVACALVVVPLALLALGGLFLNSSHCGVPCLRLMSHYSLLMPSFCIVVAGRFGLRLPWWIGPSLVICCLPVLRRQVTYGVKALRGLSQNHILSCCRPLFSCFSLHEYFSADHKHMLLLTCSSGMRTLVRCCPLHLTSWALAADRKL
jgi:hypothetical protein